MMILTLFLTVAMLVAEVAGHGYLMEPPARNTMWRAGFESEPNYNDNELNCGGAGVSRVLIHLSLSNGLVHP